MFKKLINRQTKHRQVRRQRESSSNANQFDFQALETRQLMAVASQWFSGNKLIVAANHANTSVEVVQVGSNLQIKDLSATVARTWNYVRSAVAVVEFQGGAGHDRFINNISNLPVIAFGNGGNDYLEGYNANDILVGGEGNNTLLGYGGDDQIWGGSGNDRIIGGSGNDRLNGGSGNDTIEGGAGNDILWGLAGNDDLLGGEGNDQLVGGDGNDHLNGQAGTDMFWGENGNDVLISLDAAFGESINGGPGADILWIDTVGSSRDNAVALDSSDRVHAVSFFANGADRTLNGDRISDPTTLPGHTYKRFSSNPLFSSSGPRISDITQGQLGDCYFLAGLSAVAQDNSWAIRQQVVDFNDGTFGVRLGNSFYRVDDDLPVLSSTATSPAYAQLGAQNSMWVAILEKAFAHYRYGQNGFASIQGGWSVEVNRAFGSTTASVRNIYQYANSTAMANDIASRFNGRQAVTVGFWGQNNGVAVGGAPLVMGHMYTVTNIIRNANGVVTGIQLRNPWGVDGTGNDGLNDGYVIVTPAQLFAQSGQVNFGRV